MGYRKMLEINSIPIFQLKNGKILKLNHQSNVHFGSVNAKVNVNVEKKGALTLTFALTLSYY
jgi:hypothetical protein